MLYRQGDVLMLKVKEIPERANKVPHRILAHGELTGHAHRVSDKAEVDLYASGGSVMYLAVRKNAAPILHEEHGTIQLPIGIYKVWRQREYSPKEIHIIRD